MSVARSDSYEDQSASSTYQEKKSLSSIFAMPASAKSLPLSSACIRSAIGTSPLDSSSDLPRKDSAATSFATMAMYVFRAKRYSAGRSE